MGRTKVIEILIEHAGKALGEMMRIPDGTGMTGFMLACRWNKAEVVQTLIGSSIGKCDVYEGFILACKHQKKKIIDMILQNDEFRKHILIEEKEKGNAIVNPNGIIELRQQTLYQNQELVISFDAIPCKNQLDIKIKVNSTINEEEVKGNDGLGELKRGPPNSHPQPDRSSLQQLALKNKVKDAHAGLNLAHLIH